MNLLLSLFLAFPAFSDLPPSLGESNFRCLFVSSETKTRVVHAFKIPRDYRLFCEYGITVGDKTILQARAFGDDCRSFMRTQINKGSVCITDEFDF